MYEYINEPCDKTRHTVCAALRMFDTVARPNQKKAGVCAEEREREKELGTIADPLRDEREQERKREERHTIEEREKSGQRGDRDDLRWLSPLTRTG